MTAPDRHLQERQRLATLRTLGLLDTPAEERFDRITRLAQRLFDVPVALVSLVDEDRQWFKSRQGLDVEETPREVSFCGHAILGDGVMQIPDATVDPRFTDNPLVLGDPRIRFYAGCPIAAPDGSKLGTLCVIDSEPRVLSDADQRMLGDLAELVEREIAVVQMALDDELTGLSNRRGFLLIAEKVLDVCVRQGVAAAVVYADLDGLKAVNDRYGHEEGDRAIREAAALLTRTFRSSDVIGRLGGDEFAVLLTGKATAPDAVERFRLALARRNALSSHVYPLDVSIGVAEFDPAEPIPLVDLLDRADQAMYAAKHSARGPTG
ncbi:MAG: sensor domain-containing diguanylate cyclase [Acidimicrobiales bacterium]